MWIQAKSFNGQRLFETISSSPTVSSNPWDYTEAHCEEVRELVCYGDYTLQYMLREFLDGDQTGLQCHLMRIILDELAPETMKEQYHAAWVLVRM